MPILANPKYERFAQLRADGKSRSEAYRIVAGRAKNSDVNGDKWQRAPGVAERVAELQGKAADKCSLSRDAYIKSLVEMYEAKPSNASMDNPRCDVLITRGQKHAVFPQKLAVATQLSKLVGWDRPTEVRVETGSELTSLLGRLFEGGATLGGGSNGGSSNGERSQETSGSASGGRR
jgi:hypothetical protein